MQAAHRRLPVRYLIPMICLAAGLGLTLGCAEPQPPQGLTSEQLGSLQTRHVWRPIGESDMPPRRVPQVTAAPMKSEQDRRTVILLGLDGADWRIIEPMMSAGLMPNLERMLAGGAAGVLQTDFAHSPTSWTTIATGKVPAKHGVNPDLNVSWGAQDLEPRDIRVRRVWEIAREMGGTISVYNYFFCRVRPAGEWGWIPHLPVWDQDELPKGLTTEGCYEDEDTGGLFHLYLSICLIGRRHTDLAVVLCIETDAAAHHGTLAWMRRWHPELFEQDKSVPELDGDSLTETWINVDRALGELLKNRPAGSHIVICSDHGFGVPNASTYQALIGIGTLEALDIDRRMIEDDESFDVDGAFGRLRVTRSWRSTSVPVARFKGRPEPEKAWLAVEQLLIEHKGWFDSGWAEKMEQSLRQELGPNFALLRIDRLGRKAVLIAPRDEKLTTFLSRPQMNPERRAVDAAFVSGSHNTGDDGIVLIIGPKVRPGARIDSARLVDITPTILYLLGLPAARDMDGRVLSEAFQPEALAADPVKYVDTYETSPIERDPISLDDLNKAPSDIDPELLQRLKSLGYLQ